MQVIFLCTAPGLQHADNPCQLLVVLSLGTATNKQICAVALLCGPVSDATLWGDSEASGEAACGKGDVATLVYCVAR